MGFHNLVNTAQFSYTARDWKKNGGRYTTAPKGSRDYFQFWEQEEERCLYGYKVGDLWVPGRMYGYLNFFPISRVPEAVMMKALAEGRDKRGNLSLRTAEKVIGFPAFWEIQYEWWNFKHIAWYGGTFMGIESPGGKHIGCLKTRGAGFSYMEAWDGIYNYNFIHGSKSYYFAGSEPYLIGDGIMDKVQSGLDFLNANSPYWKKNRQKKFTLMHQKASYVDAYGVEKGVMSEIIAQIVDKPKKTRGKRGLKQTYEEAGAFPGLEDALEVGLGSLREGTVYVGQASVFGTGGETGPDIQGLENIFNEPDTWDMLAFPNIYDEGLYGTQCGYFVPCYRANSFFMDADGNVDIPGAIKADEIERDKKRKSPKPKDLDRRVAEYPRTPSEALQRLTGNGFNVPEVQAQIRKIQTSRAIQEMLRYGKLTRSGEHGEVEFTNGPKSKYQPIEDYPHSLTADLTGCVTILQEPYRDQHGRVPEDMYKITIDPYSSEDAEDHTSLFSLKVWKQQNGVDASYTDLPVAWYAGRPKRLYDCYENLFMLCDMYNCKAQGEIGGGGQGVVSYAKTYHLLHRLENEPEMAHNKEIASKSAGNAFLMNMPPERKKLGLLYGYDWHVAPRAVNEKGNMVLNVHHIYDIAFLREMEKFNPKKGNFDRISDMIIYMFMMKERAAEVRKQHRKARAFYAERTLFGGVDTGNDGTERTEAY